MSTNDYRMSDSHALAILFAAVLACLLVGWGAYHLGGSAAETQIAASCETVGSWWRVHINGVTDVYACLKVPVKAITGT